MNNVDLTIWVLQGGALVFGLMFFWYTFKASEYSNTDKRNEFRTALNMMSKSGIAFLTFVVAYIVLNFVRVLMGLK